MTHDLGDVVRLHPYPVNMAFKRSGVAGWTIERVPPDESLLLVGHTGPEYQPDFEALRANGDLVVIKSDSIT